MWWRKYPHAVLLIFVNIIFKASCKGNGSLTFLIDDTSSMDDDIKQVRKSVIGIKEIVLYEKSSLIDNMVLVTFNDPGVRNRIVTKNPNSFKRALDAIRVHNEAKPSELDCWEPSMKGLLQALDKSNKDSYVFVFTDAAAKDYINSHSVIEMCQKKQTQIVFVLTGTLCSKFHYTPEAINVYFDIAIACSGLAFYVSKAEVDKVFGPIEEIIKGNKTVINTATVPANVSQSISFTIDDHTDYVIVSASGKNVTLKISTRLISQKEVMSTDNAKVIKISRAKPGNYFATVKGKTQTSVIIVGRTDFFFVHGFSKLKPKSIGDTSPQTKAGAKVYLALQVTDEKHSVKIESAHLVDKDGKQIQAKLPLTEISRDFYVTEPFHAPSQSFKVALDGSVIATGKPINRTAKLPITPKSAPKIQGAVQIEVSKGDTAVLKCKIESGFPAPNITWLFGGKSGSEFTLIGGSKSVLTIKNVESKHEGKYKCVAENEVAKDEHVTTLYIKDLPKISRVSLKYLGTEGDVLLRIPCVTAGLPKPTITWKLNGHVINPSVKYSIEDGALIIRYPKVSDSNSYTCEAKNEVGTDKATFQTYIRQAPQLSGVIDKKVRIGSSASIECTVIKGEPKPTITWQFAGHSSSKYLPISGSDNVLHISRVETKHAGRYKCVARNNVGSTEHTTTLVVQDLPKIVTIVTSVYQKTEGDALLRIPCVAAGLPKPTITWKLNGRVINPSAKYSIEDGALIIRYPKVSDSNSYTCKAKNEVGTDKATFRTYIRQAPQVSGVTAKTARIGSPASIECTVNKGEPKPTITWQFLGNSSSKFVPISGSDNVLHISRVETKHAGRYKCVARNNVGSNEHTTALVVQDLPKIVTIVASVYQKTEGDALMRIPCVAAGLPKPTITWKLNGRVINPNAKYSIEDGALIIRYPKVSDSNSYTCKAKNEVGTDKATFRTYIRQAPQVSGVTAKTARIGSPASIECTVNKGEPKPTITWQFLGNSSSKFVPISGSDNVLHISRVETKHAGRYKCVARNNVGSNEHTTALVVQDLPKIVTIVASVYQKTEGDALMRIPCVAAGLPKPTITWKLNGRVINPNAKYSIEDGALIISNPKVSDSNSYTCEAKNEVGTDSATFRIYIRQAPQVSGVTAKTARIGSPASIECTVNKGEPKPTITWQFMGNSSSKFVPISGSDNVLHISRVETKHAGRYKCVARNNVGSNEHTTALVVQELSKIRANVSAIHESIEGAASFRIPCDAAGLPKPTITWKLNGHAINPSAKYSIEDGALIISYPKVSDSNSYTCEAKNEVGTDSATFRIYIRQAPQVSGVTAKTARIGSPASIECTVNKGEPKPTITWQFMGNSSSKFVPISGSDNVLHISRVETKHAGRYKCVARNNVGSNEHTTALVVQELSKIRANVSAIHESIEGAASFRIPCDAAGLPKPTITWKLNGHAINPSAKYSIEDGALIISNPKVSDSNSYTCEAKNEVGTDSATFRIYIRQAPQVSGVTAKTARIGSPASIECTVNKGEPKPTITWQFMGNSSSKFVPISGSDNVLHISRVETKHAGRYKCVARNNVGSNEHTTALVVQELSKIRANVSAIHESIEGAASFRIPCDAAGLPKPTITWKLNGHAINPSAKYSIEDGALIISNPKVSDSNSYTCEAKNEVGTDSATFRIYIRQAPQVSGVTAKTAKIGLPASIECTVNKGEPKPTITWQFMGNSSSKFVPISGSDNVLHISRVETKHAGRYKCVARNNVGSNEHTTALVVQELSKIRANVSAIHESIEGAASFRIPCDAAGLPKPTITWKLNGHAINPSAKYSIEDGALIISNPKVSDSNSYTCEAKNEVGTDSATFRIYIRQAPQVSGVTAKTAKIGLPASIECTVNKGEPKPTITWQFMGNSSSKFVPISGSDNVLHISRVETKHAGRYKCVARNNVGSNEHTTALVVQELSKIRANVSAIHESIEGAASFRIPCDAAGLPKPTITWKLNGHAINPSAKYSIEDGALIISNPKVSDSNSYTCEAKNEVGTDSATFRIYIRQAPQVSGVTAKTAKIGLPASIECTVNKGEPKPTITWQFMGNSSSKFVPISGSDNVLHISRVETKHAGRYKCVARNNVGSNEHTTALVVQELSKIRANVSAIHESIEGAASFRIPCDAAGLPKPTITWKLNGHAINPSAKYSIEDGALIISNPKVSDSNSYTCEAKNEVGTDSATFRIYIRQAPQVSGVTAKTAKIGLPASIECTVNKGEPKPTITWQFMGNSSSKFVPISGSDNVLHISRVETKHAGRYKCVARNNVGSNEHTTALVVQELSKIRANVSAIHESIEGAASFRIPCDAAGLPKPTITWKLNGHAINPSAKYSIEDGALIISNPKVSDSNSYTCEAKNEVGTDSATFRIYIRQAPQVSGVTAKTARIGSAASIECTVNKGEPKPTITWQFMGNSSSKFVPISGSDNVLHISRVETKHAGRYKCVARNNVGSNEHTTALVVQELSKIRANVSAIHESIEGAASFRIPCDAAGLPKPTITWKLNGHAINPSAKYSIEDGALIISYPKVSDSNSYTCEAKNEVGTDSATFRIYIRQLPEISGVASKNVIIGTPVSIQCMIVKGEPKPNIIWQFKDKSASKFVRISGSANALRISIAENKHAGQYKCVAQNNVGINEHVTTLIVETPPEITTKSATVEGIEGDLALRIPCDVVGIPQPVITWKRNETIITPNGKYTIEDGALLIVKPIENDSSSYTCEAKNNAGSTNVSFQAAVEKLPKRFGTEHYEYLLSGETRKLKCKAHISKSQSVKWFKTEAVSLYQSPSSTSLPLEMESLESTTASSKDYYSSMTSLTTDMEIQEPYIEIANASYQNHDGNYTCRVSDKHGNTQTQTYVVDVGRAPKFNNRAYPLNNWIGEIADISWLCEYNKNTKPKPLIEWTFNGEVLTDLNLAGLGHYTCNVSNALGAVQREFDVKSSACLISRNLRDAQYMPLILNDEGSWHTFKNTDHYTVVKQEEKITLSCPSHKETSNTFNKFPNKNTLEAHCFKGDYFIVDGKYYKLSDLQCTNTIQPTVIRTKLKCSTETSELISVGYNVPNFLEAYQVCFDHEKQMPLYTRVLMTEANNNGLSSGFNWSTYPEIGPEKSERGFTCKDTSSSCCYSKSQLVNAIDFNDGPAKKSTFIDPLNVIPVWLPCDTSKSSWENINDMVRTQLAGYTDIAAWSGTHTLQEKHGAIIPRYLWKVARLDDVEVMAIVYVNDPSPTEKDIKCKSPDVCKTYKNWLVTDKNTYCCSLPDFLKSFDILETNIGESVADPDITEDSAYT